VANVRRVGVVGASGFLGSSLLPRLARAAGTTSTQALARTIPAGVDESPSNVEWMQGDLSSPHVCAAFLERVDLIVYLAHSGTPLTSDADLATSASANMVPLLTLVQAIRDRGSPVHIVFASSGGAIYGAMPRGRLLRETDPCVPTTSYGIQKLVAEHYLRMASERGWLTAVSLRIGNAYGALLRPERLQGLVGVAFAHLVRGEPIRIFGNPENVRDYVHLDDIGRAVELALALQVPFDVYNVGTGVGHSVREVIELIGTASGRAAVVQTLPAEGADTLPKWAVLDISRARERLRWEPRVELAEGIRRLAREVFG
jgi:UDP-glucose 4-epimerase